MARWEGFTQCPGCGFNLATGEGVRSCSWGDCPYLPLELDVYCPNCRYNLMTREGNPLMRAPEDLRPRDRSAHRAGSG